MYGLIFIAPILFGLQSVALKQHGLKCDNSESGKAIFSLLFYAFSAITALVVILISGGESSPMSMVYGVFYGVTFFGFITLYDMCMKLAPLAITSFIFSLSMIVPIVLSIFIYGESLSVTHVIGFIFVVVALYFINFGNQHGKRIVLTRKWALLCLAGTLCSGFLMFSTKAFAIDVPNGNLGQFLLIGYLVCIAMTIPRFFLPRGRETINTYKFSKWVVPLALLVGLGNSIGNAMLSYLGPKINASILFPVTNSVSVIFIIVVSIFAFQEKLMKQTVMGLAFGIAAILTLSL